MHPCGDTKGAAKVPPGPPDHPLVSSTDKTGANSDGQSDPCRSKGHYVSRQDTVLLALAVSE